MPITQIPAIRASKPLTAELLQSATAGVYYTILNLTSGSGYFNHVITTNSYSSSNNIVQFKATIDGVESEFYPSAGSGASPTDDFQSFFNVRFNSSFKFEAKNVTGSTYTIYAGISYSLEV